MTSLSHIFLCTFLIMSTSAFADGVFMVVKGDIKIVSKNKAATAAKVGMKVLQSDKVISGKDARAKIVMSDKNILNISPDTELVIETYKFNDAKNEKNVSLNVIYGKVRATVNQKYDGEKNKFQVKTPSAVAGVRGTDFLTSYSPTTNASKVVTFEGSVTVGSGIDSSGNIQNPVNVPAGTFSVASNSAAPTEPAPVPPAELQAMNKETNSDSGGRPDSSTRSPAAGENGGDKKDKGESDKSDGKSDSKSDGKSDGKADSKTDRGSDKGRSESGQKGGNSKEGSAGNSSKPGSASNTTGGTRTPATVDGPKATTAPPPPSPSMISNMGSEIRDSAPVLPTLPDLPPVLVDIYKPPEIPADQLQQSTNLTVNINVQ